MGLDHDSVRLVPEAITPEEEQQLVQELEKPLRRRRLMANHWDRYCVGLLQDLDG